MQPLDYAIAYLRRGWVPIPLCWPDHKGRCACGKGHGDRSTGKAPLLGTDYQDVRPTEADVRAWWSRWPQANVGILLEPSGLVVVDLDSPEAQTEVQDRLTPSATVSTGKGTHTYYQAPANLPGRRINKWGESKAIDLLGKGYIVAPPSIHATGRVYTWDDPGAELGEAPQWVVDTLTPTAPPKPRRRLSFTPPELAEVRSALYALSPDCSREEWIKMGMAVHDATGGSGAGLDLWDAWSSGGSSYRRGEPARVWRGFEAGTVTQASLFRAARDAGWRPERPAQRPRKVQPTPPPHTDEDAPPDPTGPPHGDGDGEGDMAGDPGTPDPVVVDMLPRRLPIPDPSHVTFAREVVRGMGSVVVCEGAVWRYDTPAWTRVDDSALRAHVHDLNGRGVVRGYDKDGDPVVKPLWLRSGEVTGIAKELECLGELRDDRHFRDARRGLCFGNGFLSIDADGWTLLDAAPEHGARWVLDWDWDEGAECPTWNAALWAWFAEHLDPTDAEAIDDAHARAAFLQEFAGAALLGIAPDYAICAILLGGGANGKSVFVQTLQGLFPPEARASINPQQLSGSSYEYYLARLAGVRLNSSSELPESEVVSSEAFKAVVPGDPVEARHPGGRPFTLQSTCANLFSANALPPVRDQSDGWWRRFVVVPFDRTFAPHERDPGLIRKLEAERPGITRWAVAGAVRLLQQGQYTVPPSSDTLKEQWRNNADKVALWLDDRCERITNHAHGLKKRPAFEDFKEWVSDNCFRSMSSRAFWKRLDGHVGEAVKTSAGLRYPIQLKAGGAL